MKKTIIIIASVICFIALFAEETINIHKKDNSVIEIAVSTIDSIIFTNNDLQLDIHKTGDNVDSYLVADIDSISFGDNNKTIELVYSENSVSVTNPFENSGIVVVVEGADVVVNSLVGIEVNYKISGSSSNGSLKIYSDTRFELQLNGINLTKTDGPAINIQSRKKVTVNLMDGKTNTLADGSVYTENNLEDQKSTFFSEGQLLFKGNGSLSVSSLTKHAICSDDYIQIDNGNIMITSAGKDGIHAKDYFKLYGGNLNITSSDDGIGCEGHVLIAGGSITNVSSVANVKGINCDSTLTISGGTINLTMNGNQSKCMKSAMAMSLNGGTLNLNTTGTVVLEASGSGYDPSYPTAIKSDADITLGGSNIIISGTGAGSKGISSDTNISMAAGTVQITSGGNGTTYTNASNVTDSYNSSCITSNGNVSIIGGNLTCINTGNGGKGINADGTVTIGSSTESPTISLTTTGSKFAVSSTSTYTSTGGGRSGGSTSSTDYCHPKTLVSDGAVIINNGNITISSTDDGIHGETALTINGGTTNITTSVEGVESNIITMNDGTLTILASDDGVNATAGLVSGGSESDDGSYFYMNGGTLITSATSGDAIDSNGKFLMTGGTLVAFGPANTTNEDIDVNGSITVNGGTFFGACYNSSMYETIASSAIYGVNLKSSSTVSSAGSYFRIQTSTGTDLGTFITPRAAYYFHFASPSLAKSTTYYVYTGGSYSGGTTYGSTSSGGYSAGGTYGNGTQKKTFTTGTSYITTVSNW